MISLSNLIKHTHYTSVDDRLKIKVVNDPSLHVKQNKEAMDQQEDQAAKEPMDEAMFAELKRKVMREAEQQAEALMKQTVEKAKELKEQAEEEIEQWWEERRKLDDEHIVKAQEEGRKQGYEAGLVQAKEEIDAQYKDFIEQGRELLVLAQQNKEQIIREAEPFLLELSCMIAEKIVRKQLTVSPEWIIELVKETLLRKRGKGLVTLSVSPDSYPYVQQFREELLLVLDSEAELQIMPDGNIQDQGCVIRSSYGSIDATIDTQLEEIKQALYHIAIQSGDDVDGHST